MEKQANGDTSHDAERPVEIWGVSCPDHKIQANRYEFERNFGNRFLPTNVRAKRATTAGRQARAGENVPRTARPGLVACRWRSA